MTPTPSPQPEQGSGAPDEQAAALGQGIDKQIEQGVLKFVQTQDPEIAVEVVNMLAQQMGIAPDVDPYADQDDEQGEQYNDDESQESGVRAYGKGGRISIGKKMKDVKAVVAANPSLAKGGKIDKPMYELGGDLDVTVDPAKQKHYQDETPQGVHSKRGRYVTAPRHVWNVTKRLPIPNGANPNERIGMWIGDGATADTLNDDFSKLHNGPSAPALDIAGSPVVDGRGQGRIAKFENGGTIPELDVEIESVKTTVKKPLVKRWQR